MRTDGTQKHSKVLIKIGRQLFCTLVSTLWKRAHRVQAAPPASGVSRVSKTHRRGRARSLGRNSDPGQLCHPQTRQGAHMAGGKTALPSSLHPCLLVLDQPGRTLVRPYHPAGYPAWLIQIRQGTDRQNQPIRPALQSKLQTLRLDRYSRFHLPKTCQTMFAYFWDITLVIRLT